VDKLILPYSAYSVILGEISSATSFLGRVKNMAFVFEDGMVELDGREIE